MYLDLVWILLPHAGPDRSVDAVLQPLRQQNMMLCEDEGRAIWIPKPNVNVSSGNRPGELTNHIWYFKLGWG